MRPLHVLLVDDNPADLALASAAFDQHSASVLLTTCSSGVKALTFLRDATKQRPDVAVLDINMPVMSGFDVLRQMKEDDLLMDIPVVMLSTSSNRLDVQLAYTMHASSYLVKRTEFPEFVQQIDTFVAYLQEVRLTTWPDSLND